MTVKYVSTYQSTQQLLHYCHWVCREKFIFFDIPRDYIEEDKSFSKTQSWQTWFPSMGISSAKGTAEPYDTVLHLFHSFEHLTQWNLNTSNMAAHGRGPSITSWQNVLKDLNFHWRLFYDTTKYSGRPNILLVSDLVENKPLLSQKMRETSNASLSSKFLGDKWPLHEPYSHH